MKPLVIIFLVLSLGLNAGAQHTQTESDTTKTLEEVSVTAMAKRKIETELKMAVSVDEFLASSDHIRFIKSGAYAWYPLLNKLSQARSQIPIDGIHTFVDCIKK